MMPYVRRFAEKYQAEVILLHVVNPVYMIPETGVSGAIAVPLPARNFTGSGEQLEHFATAELEGLRVRRLLYEGDPETQIAETAETEDVQLVIMPTRGHGVFRRFLLGSITAKVLHDVGRPVLTGAHVDGHATGSVSNIVCAVKLDDRTEQVVAWAAGLANDFEARLAVVHAVRDRSDPQLRARLQEALKGLSGVEVQVEEGEVSHAVCSFAQNTGADLLVIGRGAQAGQRLRHDAYGIIRQSPCPVLSV